MNNTFHYQPISHNHTVEYVERWGGKNPSKYLPRMKAERPEFINTYNATLHPNSLLNPAQVPLPIDFRHVLWHPYGTVQNATKLALSLASESLFFFSIL